jgi:nucleotide-binding universal stress UspA family protein
MVTSAQEILAGYDGSAASDRALSWAAREAHARRLGLTICHAWSPEGQEMAAEALLPGARERATQILARGIRHAQCVVECDKVRPLLAEGVAWEVLCESGGGADMVVLGSLGLGGGAPGLLLGSVSSKVAACATGRVVVERGHWHPAAAYVPGPVVAGIDGSPSSRAVLGFAFEEAALRQAPLLAVCALADASEVPGGARQLQEDFDDLLTRSEKENPEVTVLRHIAGDGAVAALLRVARDAQIVVVGCRRRGTDSHTLLGSVSRAVLRQAPCPVGIVHQH